MGRLSIAVALGFLAGAAVGLAWGQAARSSVAGAVTAEMDGATVTVKVDGGKIAASGFSGILAGL